MPASSHGVLHTLASHQAGASKSIRKDNVTRYALVYSAMTDETQRPPSKTNVDTYVTSTGTETSLLHALLPKSPSHCVSVKPMVVVDEEGKTRSRRHASLANTNAIRGITAEFIISRETAKTYAVWAVVYRVGTRESIKNIAHGPMT